MNLNCTSIQLRSPKGFTLVELMIVVAIIGLLSSVAVPSFQRFAFKARQVEAKTSLSAAFEAEKIYYGEFSTYTSCLGSIGVDIPTGNRRYTVGFEDARAEANLCGDGTMSCYTESFNSPLVPCPTRGSTVVPADDNEGHSIFYASPFTVGFDPGDPCTPLSFISKSSFTMHACGHINPSLAIFDYWTIDDHKQLINVGIGY